MLDQRQSAQGYRAPASVIERCMVAWEKDDEDGQALTAITDSQSRKTLSRKADELR